MDSETALNSAIEFANRAAAMFHPQEVVLFVYNPKILREKSDVLRRNPVKSEKVFRVLV